MTFLHQNIVSGTINSRRLGKSFGLNILPNNQKFCNFECIYCECGSASINYDSKNAKLLPTVQQIAIELEEGLKGLEPHEIIDSITFSGNGEPTINPDFAEIIDETIRLRNKYRPGTKISVLTNATTLNNPKVVAALHKIEMPILKIDSVFQQEFEIINGNKHLKINEIINNIKNNFKSPIIQTIFLKAENNGQIIDNTTSEQVEKYIEIMKFLSPQLIMIYSVSRDTAIKNIEKIALEKLQEIGTKIEKIGIKTLITQ